jgi:Fe(3+) dicitrate transport protein
MIVGEKVKSVTGSCQYINTKRIEKLNQPIINNVLRTIPGVNIRDEEGFGLRPNIGLRGTPVNRSAKITLMEDGILMAPAPYADPSAYYFPTFARMQGVEVLKGSSQIKYGPYTVGGAVNLISTLIPDSFKGFAQLSYGSFGTNQQRLWVGDSQKNFDYVFEVNRLASQGFKEIDNGGNTGFDRRDFMGKVRWHTDDVALIPQSLTLKFVNSTEESNETYLGLTFDDYLNNPLRRYAGTEKDILDMNHQHVTLSHMISPVRGLTVNSTAYITNTFRDWARANSFGGQSINNILADPVTHQSAYQVMTGKANGNIIYQSAARNYESMGIQSNALYIFHGDNKMTHKIYVGIRYHKDQADRYATRSAYAMANGRMILSSSGVKGDQENQLRSAEGTSAYVNYEWVWKGLKVSPGLRYEHIKFDFMNFGNSDNGRVGNNLRQATNDLKVLLPGIGLNYDFNNFSGFFAGVHKGFSPPGMPSVTSVTGQAKEESAWNYELGYRYQNKGLQTQIAGFVNQYNNILGSDNVSGGGAGTGDLFNAGRADIKGLELSLEYNLLNNIVSNNSLSLPVNIAYTWTDARFNETFINGGGDWGSGKINSGDFIPFITPQLLTVSAGIEGKRFDVTLVSRYVGETRTKPGQSSTIIPGKGIKFNDVNALKGFMIMDLSANYQLNKKLSIFSTINNLTNNTGIVANLPQGYRPNIPLSMNVGAKLKM